MRVHWLLLTSDFSIFSLFLKHICSFSLRYDTLIVHIQITKQTYILKNALLSYMGALFSQVWGCSSPFLYLPLKYTLSSPGFWLSLFVFETTSPVSYCHHICLLRVFHTFRLSKSCYLSPCYHFWLNVLHLAAFLSFWFLHVCGSRGVFHPHQPWSECTTLLKSSWDLEFLV